MPALTSPLSRTYTPPTCTLEVTAQTSALSRWTGSPVVKSLQFLLSFDGLSREDREPVEIRGDRHQFDALAQSVTGYIQQILATRHTDLPVQSTAMAPLASPTPDDVPGEIGPSEGIQLRPRSLLAHELILGNLATDLSGPSVTLKVSQLFDLATALEDCTSDFQQLPDVATPLGGWQNTIAPWAKGAAVAMLAVGLGTATWQLFFASPGNFTLTQSESSAPSTAADQSTASLPKDFKLAQEPPPSPRPSVPLNLPKIQLPNRAETSARPDSAGESAPASGNSASGSFLPAPSAQQAPSELALPPEPDLISPPLPTFGGAPADSEPAPSQPTGAIAPTNRQAQQKAPGAGASLSQSGVADSNPQELATGDRFAAPRSAAPAPAAEALPAAPAAGDTAMLFDTIPQVQEVRQYIARRQQSRPSRPVEYRLTLNANGSLAKVEALSPTAKDYLGNLPVPAPQQPFVSPIPAGGQPKIRVLLQPNGTVKTFLEAPRP